MKSETRNTTLMRFSDFTRCLIAGSINDRAGRRQPDAFGPPSRSQHCWTTDQAAARVRRGGVDSSTRSENARNPVLIWSDTAEKTSDPVMNVITSFFEY